MKPVAFLAFSALASVQLTPAAPVSATVQVADNAIQVKNEISVRRFQVSDVL
jgi:hypothetical protein